MTSHFATFRHLGDGIPPTNDHTLAQICARACAHRLYTIAVVITAALLAGMLLFWWILARLDERAAHEAPRAGSSR